MIELFSKRNRKRLIPIKKTSEKTVLLVIHKKEVDFENLGTNKEQKEEWKTAGYSPKNSKI
jgi:hypothetical protein